MLEFKLFHFYLKKYWYIFLLIILYNIILLTYFALHLEYAKNPNSQILLFFNGLDLIFLGICFFPIFLKKIQKNDFYNNYLLKNNNNFKSKFKILIYFIILLLIFAFIKRIIFYSIENLIIDANTIHKYRKFNFEVSLFGDVHLVASSIFVGNIFVFWNIKKNFIFNISLLLIFPLILIFTFFYFGSSIIRWRENLSTDVFSKQIINVIFTFRDFYVFTPLAGGYLLYAFSQKGAGFPEFYNFELFSKINYNELLELRTYWAIWVTVSFFIYIILLMLFCYFDNKKMIRIKSKFQSLYFKKR